METCTYPGCGYKADFISKVHCRTVHGIEREEMLKKYGKSTDLKHTRAKMSLENWVPTKEQIDRARRYGVSESSLRSRGKLGWDIETAITTPKMSKNEAGRLAAGTQLDWSIKRGRD